MVAQSSGKKDATTIILIVLVVGVVACSVLGILAAIAVPSFLKYQARAKQGECKAMLKAAFTAQKSLYGAKDAYSTDPVVLGMPTDTQRATLFFGDGHSVPAKVNPVEASDLPSLPRELRPGVRGECPKCEFLTLCAANVDNDPTLDVWWVASYERTCKGAPQPAGVPCNEENDAEH